MLPDDAVDRINAGCQTIGTMCKNQGIEQWEIVAYQSYGHQLDIEAGKISLGRRWWRGRVWNPCGGGRPIWLRLSGGRRSSADSSTETSYWMWHVPPHAVAGFVLPSAAEEAAPKSTVLCDRRILRSLVQKTCWSKPTQCLSEVASLDASGPW